MNSRRLPRLRHHAARRRPARGHHVLGRRQARGRAAAGRARRRASSRAAGPARCRRTPSSSPGPRPRARPAARPARRLRRDPQGRRRVARRPQVRRCSTRRRPGGHAWSRSPTSATSSGRCAPRCEENLAMVRDTVDFLVRQGRRVFVDCEHFFDGFALDPDYGRDRARGGARGRRRASASCATPTAACSRSGSTGVVARRARRQPAAAARHPLPGRHRAARSPTPWPRSRRA